MFSDGLQEEISTTSLRVQLPLAETEYFFAVRAIDGAGNEDAPLFVFGYFAGAWDTLLSLDPRSSNEANGQIDPAYQTLAANDAQLAAVLQANPGGIIQAAGGIHTLALCEELLEAGATALGTSSGPQLLQAFRAPIASESTE